MSVPGSRSGEWVVEVEGLSIGFPRHPVIDELDLQVRRGEIVGLVGPSGAGKSVLLKAVLGLVRPQAGHARVFGEEIAELSGESRRRLLRRLGVLYQEDALFSSITVEENITQVIWVHSQVRADLAAELARLKLQMVGLPPGTGAKYPAELSGGMAKKAALARALALDPEILFLDEPTSELDSVSARRFQESIRELHKALGLTIVMITHDLGSVLALCHRVAVLGERRLLLLGTPDEVTRARDRRVRTLFDAAETGATAA